MTLGAGKLPKAIYVAVLVTLVTALSAGCALPLPPTSTLTQTPPSVTSAAPPPAEKPIEKQQTTPTPPPSKATGTPMRIGYLTPLTGPLGPLGHLEKISLLLAEEDISKEGGIAGSPLQIIRYNSSDPRQAENFIRKLANEDGALAILGPFSSEEMDVAASLSNQLQIPIIGMRATKPGVFEKHRPWAFQVTVTDDIHAKAVVTAFKKLYPKVKKVLIVGETKESATESMIKEVWPKHLAEAGYEVQGTVTYASRTTDYGRIVADIKDRKPEAIAYSVPPPRATLWVSPGSWQPSR